MRKTILALIISAAVSAVLAGCYALPQGAAVSSADTKVRTDEPGEIPENTENVNAAEDKAGDKAGDKADISSDTQEDPSSGQETEKDPDEIMAEVTSYSVKCEVTEGIAVTGSYPRIDLSDDQSEKYPKLDAALDKLDDDIKDTVETEISYYGGDALSYFSTENGRGPGEADMSEQYGSMFLDVSAQIKRADDRLFTVLLFWSSYAGGAHPMHWTESYNFAADTGDLLQVSDVLNRDDSLSEEIYDEVMKKYEDLDLDPEWVKASIEDMVLNDLLCFSVDDKGLNIYFSPYDIAPYAFGDLDITLKEPEHEDLIKSEFLPPEGDDPSGRIKEREDKNVIRLVPVSYDQDEDGNGGMKDKASVGNPTWGYYRSDRTKGSPAIITLEKRRERKEEWINPELWISNNGIENASLPYQDGDYQYRPYDTVSRFYDYQALLLCDPVNDAIILDDLDLSVLLNGPDEEKGQRSEATQYIRYAKAVDGILYVSFGHNGNSGEEPDSGYVAAIDLSDNTLLWKSEPLVCNSQNFIILSDALICGYGYTDEDDLIYVLNLSDGSVNQKIPLSSAPEVFGMKNDYLYVCTYDTEYIFGVTFG
ncbi:MAG: RsiV family protein [Lachnospiraceae bacterium]|nr:RsiV family protein [Lachnospiraceae bacterium]